MSNVTWLVNFIKEQSKQNGSNIMLGKIVSPPPDIKISLGDIIIGKEMIWINNYLVVNQQRDFNGNVTLTSGTSNNYTMTGDITFSDELLEVGDTVVIMPTENMQQYIVLSKVVQI